MKEPVIISVQKAHFDLQFINGKLPKLDRMFDLLFSFLLLMMVCNKNFVGKNKRILIRQVKFGTLIILGVNSILLSTNMIAQVSEDSFRFASRLATI